MDPLASTVDAESLHAKRELLLRKREHLLARMEQEALEREEGLDVGSVSDLTNPFTKGKRKHPQDDPERNSRSKRPRRAASYASIDVDHDGDDDDDFEVVPASPTKPRKRRASRRSETKSERSSSKMRSASTNKNAERNDVQEILQKILAVVEANNSEISAIAAKTQELEFRLASIEESVHNMEGRSFIGSAADIDSHGDNTW